MVCSLIRFHFGKKRGQDGSIYPPYVPVLFLIGTEPEVGLIGAILQYFILGVQGINYKWPIIHVFFIRVQSLTPELTVSIELLVEFYLGLQDRRIHHGTGIFGLLFGLAVLGTLLRILNHVLSAHFVIEIAGTSFVRRRVFARFRILPRGLRLVIWNVVDCVTPIDHPFVPFFVAVSTLFEVFPIEMIEFQWLVFSNFAVLTSLIDQFQFLVDNFRNIFLHGVVSWILRNTNGCYPRSQWLLRLFSVKRFLVQLLKCFLALTLSRVIIEHLRSLLLLVLNCRLPAGLLQSILLRLQSRIIRTAHWLQENRLVFFLLLLHHLQ